MQIRVLVTSVLLIVAVAPHGLLAQDTTAQRGVYLSGTYDPTMRPGLAVLPVSGAMGDSIRAIVQRDLDFSDRFTMINVDSTDPASFRAPNAAGGLNYPMFAQLGAAVVIQITRVPAGLHVALHEVSRNAVAHVDEFSLVGAPLSREWRFGLHALSDELQRWITGERGIAATRIAYNRAGGIHIVDVDGSDDVPVPTPPNVTSASWNPSGTMLTFATYAEGSRVMVLDLTTGRSRTLVGEQRSIGYCCPAFAPDGRSVIYQMFGDNGSDLFSIPLTGSEPPHVLTVGRGTDNSLPTYSPDGRRIAFVSGRLGHPEIYYMDADGTNLDILTNFAASDENYRSDPDWSPDGRLVAFQSRINGRFQIMTINVRDGSTKLLTSEGENEQPSWAPDARHLVFTSTRSGVRQLWIIDVESSRTRQLTTTAGSRLGKWSPRLSVPASPGETASQRSTQHSFPHRRAR